MSGKESVNHENANHTFAGRHRLLSSDYEQPTYLFLPKRNYEEWLNEQYGGSK